VTVGLVLGALLAVGGAQADTIDEGPQATGQAPAAAPAMTRSPPAVAPATQGRERLLILNLDAAGVDGSTAKIINGLVTQGLAPSTSLEVITSADLGALVNLEAERAATGCDTTSCLAEIAGAMGTRFVIFGTVGRLGDVTLVQLSLYDSEAARPVAREEVRAKDEGELLDTVPRSARSLVSTIVASDDPLLTADARAASVADSAPVDNSGGIGLLPIALFATGGGLAAVSVLVGFVGTTFFVIASSALVDTSGAVTADLKNNFFRPFGPFGAIAGGLAMVGFGVGAAVATAGFFVE
jgi:hypothetical protein